MSLLSYLIQRFCLHDGAGIRTNLFLKGCSLACKWCQNPESIKNEVEMSFDISKCIGCGLCHEECQEEAIQFGENLHRIDYSKCINCGDCAKVCPSQALQQIGEYRTVSDIFQELILDKSFFDVSGGGGGEPLLQSDPLKELLKKLKDEGINTIIETSAAVSWKNFEDLIPYVDEFFVDVKSCQENHKELTSGSQQTVMNNLSKLLQLQGDVPSVKVRMPVIPGLNDSEDCVRALSEQLVELGVDEIQLLEYHRMYQTKIDKIDSQQEKIGIIPDGSACAAVADIMNEYGIETFLPEIFTETELDYSILSDRIYEVKELIQNTERELCTERVNIFTEWYKQKGNLEKHPLVGRAEVLSYYLNNKTTRIYDEDFLVGNSTSKRLSGPIFYDLHGIGVIEDLFKFEKREVNSFKVSKGQRWDLIKALPFWFRKNVNAVAFDGKIIQFLKKARQWTSATDFFLNENSGFSHINPDFGTVISKGTRQIAKEARENKLLTDDPEKELFYEGIEIMCEGMENWAIKYSELAEEMSNQDDISEERKKELKEISRVCKKVPAHPAGSMHEALQAMLFFQIGIMNEALDNGVCPGRLDYYLYPYYLLDKSNGVSDDEIRELLSFYFIKLNEPVPVFSDKITSVHGGMFSGQTLNIGGVDSNGEDMTNELTYMLMDIQNLLRMRQPNFYARVHSGTPKKLLNYIAQMLRDGSTTPAIANDEVVIPQLVERGMSLEHARDYLLCGCVEPISCGRTYGSTDSSLNNLPLCLERALGLKKGGCENEKNAIDCENIEEVFELYVNQVEQLINEMHADQVRIERALQTHFPTPLTSMSLEGTMDTGRDASWGGVLYNASGHQGIGPADVADSFSAMDEIVFKRKLCSMEELINALRNNFEGYEKTYQYCLNSPKYGNNDNRADKWIKRVVESFSNILTCRTNLRGGPFLAGWYSVTIHKAYGLKTGALPSGRLDGYPLSNGLSQANGADLYGPTAICNSLTSFDTVPYTGNGLNLNLTLDTTYLEGEKGVEAIVGLIDGYFQNNGHQCQFNVLDPSILIDAKENPEKYPNLLVRVSGYSSYWRDLEPSIQQDIIDRYLGILKMSGEMNEKFHKGCQNV